METLFFHGKTKDGKRFTIAGKFAQKGVIIKETLLLLGASICSHNDTFIKKVGRLKAKGRMESEKFKGRIVSIVPDFSEKNPIGIFLENAMIYNNVDSKDLQKEFNLYHNE